MSHDLERAGGNGRVNGHRDGPLSGENHPLPEVSNFRDSCGPLFSMYLKIAEEEDNKMAERWQKDADGILIFTGLFSAAVAALLAVTVLDLRPNSQDISVFYLQNIFQILADPNASRVPTPSTVVKPPPFSPPRYTIWVNALWFLSLVIGLTCALLATLLQQWARRYIRMTQRPQCSPHKRARIRAFFFEGVEKSHVSWVAEALPTLLHTSLFLFFAGLLVFLFNTNHPVFCAVVWWVALSTLAYLCVTFLPVFRPNSPYRAPLTSPIWYLYTGIPYVVFTILSSPVFGSSKYFHNLREYYRRRLSVEGIGKMPQEITWELSQRLDARILESTLDSLCEDGTRDMFFEAILGLFNSGLVDGLQIRFSNRVRNRFGRELYGFLDSTFSSGSIEESLRGHRLIISLNSTHAILGPDGVCQILYDILNGRWRGLSQSVEMAHSLRRWSNSTDDEFTHYLQRIVTQVIVGVRERDDRWIALAKAEFGVPDYVLRENIRHGDSALFSLLIHITRQAFRTGSWTPFILSSLTQFDVCNTLPELQHEFCALWNEIIQETWRDGDARDSTAISILREIRQAYIGLHQGTDAAPTAFSAHTNHFNPILARPLSYPFCNIASHCPDWISQSQDPLTDHFTVPPPTRVGLTSAGSTTRLGDSPNPSPRPAPLEIPRFPGSADIISRFPSSSNSAITQSDQTPSRTHAFFSTPRSVFIALPVTDPPIPESTGVVKAYEGTQDLNLGVSTELSLYTSQSAPSVVVDTGVNIVQPEDPMADSSSSETGESSQALVATSLAPSRPDPSPTNDILSTGLDIPTFSESDPTHTHPPDGAQEVDIHDTFQCNSSIATASHPLESNSVPAAENEDIARPSTTIGTNEILSTANQVPQSFPPNSDTSQRSEKTAIVSAVIVSDAPSTPIPMPAISSDVTLTELLSSIESSLTQPGHISNPPGCPPSFQTAVSSHVSLPVTSALGNHVTASTGALGLHDNTHDLNPHTSMESAMAAPGVLVTC